MNEQSQPQPTKSLPELVSSILRENIQPNQPIALRQPPVDDDHDQWEHDDGRDGTKWLHTAEQVIRAIDRYRSRQ